jgi:16S rRNA G966 N2-methylase RsmD
LQLLVSHEWLAPNAWVYIESAQPLDAISLPQPLDLYRHKKAGQVYYGLLRYLTNK